MKFEKSFANIVVSTDKERIDFELTYQCIANCYWAKGIPRNIFEKSFRNALCFGVYKNEKQIGFARVISDYSTFAYLADVFIVEMERGKGYSKLLLDVIMEHPELQGLRRFCLVTRDAQGLYKKYGFELLKQPENWMEIKKANIYQGSTATTDFL